MATPLGVLFMGSTRLRHRFELLGPVIATTAGSRMPWARRSAVGPGRRLLAGEEPVQLGEKDHQGGHASQTLRKELHSS